MFSLSRPTPERVEALVAEAEDAPLTYEPAGMTSAPAAAGWVVDHNRIRLGHGEATFEAACEALRGWQQFDLGWVSQLRPAERAPIALGAIAAVASAQMGLWTLNLARIIALFDEPGDADSPRRWGYTYGTLPTHVECGEERFLIEMTAEGEVFYDVLAYSKPRHWLVWLGYPYARMCQRRFGRDTKARMRRAVEAVGASR